MVNVTLRCVWLHLTSGKMDVDGNQKEKSIELKATHHQQSSSRHCRTRPPSSRVRRAGRRCSRVLPSPWDDLRRKPQKGYNCECATSLSKERTSLS